MTEFDLMTVLCLALVSLGAGFFDAIAGGGGLVTLPALLFAGLDPMSALATNKAQAAAATLSATSVFARKGLIDWRAGWKMALFAFSGSAAGALSVSLLPTAALEVAVPIMLILAAAYFAFAPKLGNEDRQARLPVAVFTAGFMPVIGFYDGVFGPGVGSFFMLGFVLLLGQGIVRAISNTKLANASSNLGALTIFALSGAIVWPVALAMATGAIIGAQLGARCAVRFGAKLIKPLLVTVCLIMAGKLMMNPDNALRQLLAPSGSVQAAEQ